MYRIIPYCCAAASLYALAWFALPPLPSSSIFVNILLFFTAAGGLRAYPGMSLSGPETSFSAAVPRCLLHAALFAAAVFGTEYALTGPGLWQQIPPGIAKAAAVYGSVPVFLVLQFSAALSEEAFYRFFLLESLRTVISPAAASFLVSAAFAALHYPAAGSLMQTGIAFLFSLDMCVMLAGSRVPRTRLFPQCVLIHFAYNLFIFIIR